MGVTVRKGGEGITRVWVVSPAAVGLGRDQVSRALREWGLALLVPDAVSIVGELMANAVRVSGRLDAVKVHVGVRAGDVVLGVWDGCRARPVRRTVELSLETLDLREENFDDNGGWGLSIVETLADRCWIEETPPRGKWVCAALRAVGR
ncbi:ATP-binding protein [Actinomadura algeriensis]|uniref:Histidine kinase/HSP90-like ATPase domain-containing protein n=1 Tax=Actinomadura algeriensis TaxID=1679523 RepID=A0ABR9JSE1_9ACTN|nr:ATP-binding protein [Actinomadura algeriensis]MBE1533298.1 hypothetical protein [Actinomadura algeriensis]